MGYRIEYVARAGTLRAVVSGKASRAYAISIAQDIADQATRQAARRVLIDVRGLTERVGTLGALLRAPASVARKVAVVDIPEHERYHVFSELAARHPRSVVRYFNSATAAMGWLNGRHD
jgi:hypothetical protein